MPDVLVTAAWFHCLEKWRNGYCRSIYTVRYTGPNGIWQMDVLLLKY